MHRYLLSIIVPSYNTERFIKGYSKIFDSNKLPNDICVIFVNDGSTDNTKELLTDFIKNKDNFFLYNKKNGGHGSAINYGIKVSDAYYIKPIDGDDEFELETLSSLLDVLKDKKYDMVLTDTVLKYLDTGLSKRMKGLKFKKKSGQYKLNTLRHSFLRFHSCIFKKDLFVLNNIVLSENCFYEDFEYFLFPLKYIKNFYYLSKDFYVYNLGVEGQSVSNKIQLKNMNSYKKVFSNIVKHYLDIGKNSKLKNIYLRNACVFGRAYLDNIYSLYKNQDNQRHDYFRDFNYWLKINKKFFVRSFLTKRLSYIFEFLFLSIKFN